MTCLIELVVCSSLMLCVSLSDDTMLAGDCGNDLPVPLATPFASIFMPLISVPRFFLIFVFKTKAICSLHIHNNRPHCITPTRKCILPNKLKIFVWYPPSACVSFMSECKQCENPYRFGRQTSNTTNYVYIWYRYMHNRPFTIATKSKYIWWHYLCPLIECIVL